MKVLKEYEHRKEEYRWDEMRWDEMRWDEMRWERSITKLIIHRLNKSQCFAIQVFTKNN
jgi:hypothetical protein